MLKLPNFAHWPGPALTALAFLCFSISDAVAKDLLANHGTAVTLVLVHGSVFLVLLLTQLWRRQWSDLWPAEWPWLLLLSVTYSVGTVAFFWVLGQMELAKLFVFIMLMPPLSIIFACWLCHERLSAQHWVGLVIAFVAVLVNLQIWHPEFLDGWQKYSWLVWSMLGLNVFLVSLRPALMRRWGQSLRPQVINLYASGLNILFASTILPDSPQLFDTLLSLPWTAILQTLLVLPLILSALILVLRGFAKGPAGLASLTQYSQIIWSALLGWLFFAEMPSEATMVAGALMLAAGLIIFWPTRPAESK